MRASLGVAGIVDVKSCMSTTEKNKKLERGYVGVRGYVGFSGFFEEVLCISEGTDACSGCSELDIGRQGVQQVKAC